jgi:glycosyltransferase involved in cell wall biosynthesis
VTSLSVIIPTRDRPELLRDTLRTLAQQDAPDGLFDVVVVDDGSATPLAPVVAEFEGGRFAARCERQPPGGLNEARNRGASVAGGAILAYLDDDVLVPPGWAAALVDGFASLGCEAVAGRIRLRLDGAAPSWLTPKLRRYLSELELGDEAFLLAPGQGDPYGANCAVTREAFERAGGFRAALDREGTSLRSNGEVEFFRRLRSGGGRVGYWPAACVEHRVPAERLTAEWFRRRAFAQGHSDVLLLPPPAGRPARALALGRELLRSGRAAPILARNLLGGRGFVGASIWLSYCRGRAATLRSGSSVSA